MPGCLFFNVGGCVSVCSVHDCFLGALGLGGVVGSGMVSWNRVI